MRRTNLLLLLMALAVFLGWRLIRPMNIFIVSDAFEHPLPTADAPAPLRTLHAEECGACHREFFDEWRTTIHSQAWTDPYFQTDWQFDDAQQICKNCHIPLERQQEHVISGFRDSDKWNPVLAPNPDFDPALQQEGVTCAACHLREGKIIGVLGTTDAPHPVKMIDDPNQVCVRCHVVEGDRWDTFFRFPPCGTVAEIQATPYSRLRSDVRETMTNHPVVPTDAPGTDETVLSTPSIDQQGGSGETVVPNTASLGCVQCHMPLVERPLIEGGQIRTVRRHLWRGGHDPTMVTRGLEVRFEEEPEQSADERIFILTLTNVGAAHYLPTGTPDRFLSVDLRLLDSNGRVLKEQHHTLKRFVMWRPFIIDLWDTRLPRWQPRRYEFSVPPDDGQPPVTVEAVVRYHLLDEKRRRRIGYENREPIAYEIFRQELATNPLPR